MLSIPFAIVTIVSGIVAPGFAAKTFKTSIIIFLLLGILSKIATLVVDYKFAPCIPVLFFSIALALVAYYGAPIIMDMINKINFLNGDGSAVIVYIIFTSLACIASVVSCFAEHKKSEEKEVA